MFVLIVFYCFFCCQPEQSQGGEENIDVDATIASAVKAVENLVCVYVFFFYICIYLVLYCCFYGVFIVLFEI